MDLLTGLEPDRVFYFFEAISDIPRGSGNTGAVRQYLIQFAEERGLDVMPDEAGNVLIRKNGSAGYENSPAVILQAHMDMVCVKTSDSDHDFNVDPLDLFLEEDMLYADRTSLGADDGIGVAMILAVLDDESLAHPPIEALFTNDEEIGLLGAAAFDTSVLKGRRMINLDSEKEGELTCGCAGGECLYCVLPVEKIRMKGLPVLITISGLKGGHSGTEISLWRANANKLAGRLLNEIDNAAAFSLESVAGGEKDNAIPTEARIRIVIDEDDFQAVSKAIDGFERAIRREYRGIEDDIRVRAEKGNTHKIDVLDMDSQDKVISLLLCLPDGVLQMSGAVPGMVQTSCNLGVIRTGDSEFACTINSRSSVSSGMAATALMIRSLAEKAGAAVRSGGAYPGWDFRDHSPLRDTMVEVYKEMYGEEPRVCTIHAGLECGLFVSSVRGLDVVSMGCDVMNIHTVSERLSISSTARTWDYLKEILAKLK